MSYYHELQQTMTPEKKANAKNDYFAFYVGRPLSYVASIPFLRLHIRPNTVSLLATIEVIIAAVVLSTSTNIVGGIFGWLLMFIWNLLDGVDGNIARLRKAYSPMGSVIDAMSGYAAMFLLFFSAGIYAFNTGNSNLAYLQIIIGSVSGMSQLFPRLVMHKARNTMTDNDTEANELTDKKNFSFLKVVALNLTSIAGLVQPILLVAILFGMVTWFNYIYCAINITVMVGSLYKIFK